MTWRNYTVTVLTTPVQDVALVKRRFTVRGISVKDVAYVLTNPCKRNNHKPLLGDTDNVYTIEVTQ